MAAATAVPFDQMPGVVWFDGKLVPNVDAKKIDAKKDRLVFGAGVKPEAN